MKDGGSAFPCVYRSEKEGSNGMSLRDYFAGQFAASGCDPELCYKKADAMLKERDKVSDDNVNS